VKRTLFIIVLIVGCLAGAAFWYISPILTPSHLLVPPTPTVSPTPSPKQKQYTVSFDNQTFAYGFFRASPNSLIVIPNYTKKNDFSQLLSANNCTGGVNGGFYDQNNNPLGLVVTDGNVIHPAIVSDLFNGFLSVSKNNQLAITSAQPVNPKIAIQSGPILVDNGNPLPLTIHNDENSRRMIAATEKDGKVIFMTVYNPDSVFDGPKLTDLPAIISRIGQQQSFLLMSALNLDGGSASAFQSPDLSLSELKPIGAVLCVHF